MSRSFVVPSDSKDELCQRLSSLMQTEHPEMAIVDWISADEGLELLTADDTGLEFMAGATLVTINFEHGYALVDVDPM